MHKCSDVLTEVEITIIDISLLWFFIFYHEDYIKQLI